MVHLAVVATNPTRLPGAQAAHDMRNILASIGLHLETLQRLSGPSGAKADNIAHRCPVDLVQTARKMNIAIKPENISSRDTFADKVSLRGRKSSSTASASPRRCRLDGAVTGCL